MPLDRNRCGGIWAPLVTPFRDDAPDLGLLERLVNWLLERGVSGFLALGSTAETPHLDEDEALDVLRCVVGAVARRVPVLVGCGRPSTRATQRMLERSAREGADAGLVLMPSYYRTQLRPESLLAFYHQLADTSPIPVFVYHIPQVTGMELEPDLLVRILTHPNVGGFKDSTTEGGPLQGALAQTQALGFVGHGGRLVAALEAGACGGILAVADVLPEVAVHVHTAYRAGRVDEAREWQSLLQALITAWRGHGIAGVKAGLRRRGFDCGSPRPPLSPLTADVENAVALAVDTALGRVEAVRARSGA